MKLFGIKNCDTVRKARKWLDQHGADYQYHDFREQGLEESQVKAWLARVPAERLVNKRSTTWKQLDEATRDNLSGDNLPALLAAHPTLIKRPVLEIGEQVHTGFSEKTYQQLIN